MERKYIHCFVLTAEFSKRISGNYQNQFYLSPKSTPRTHAHNPLQSGSIGMPGILGAILMCGC